MKGTPSPHHVGMYYYCSYWRIWDKLLGIDDTGRVTVVECDMDGNPVAEPRKHRTAMELRYFAAKPFKVTPKDLYL